MMITALIYICLSIKQVIFVPVNQALLDSINKKHKVGTVFSASNTYVHT